MPNETGLPADTESIMLARQLADQIMRGKRGLSAGERIALAEGFQACDRQRMEAVRARQVALSEEDVEALTYVRFFMDELHMQRSDLGAELGAMAQRGLAVLDRLLAPAADEADALFHSTGGGK